ncbi:MAG: DUF4339 domain-containing protein [Planctomycetota bacterium]|nr:MAG: DUF4339 domain-containing protein [Planctomycetota bacterium]
MGIIAYCPNGHRMKVKDELGNKNGLCPECGVKFRIPAKDEQVAAVPVLKTGGQAVASAVLPLAAAGEPKALAPEATPEYMPEATPEDRPESQARQFHPAINEQLELAWCIAFVGGEPTPPYSAEMLQDWLDAGESTGEEIVWRADWPEWLPVRQVFPEYFFV